MASQRNYSLSTLITSGLLVAFIGFGVGFNWLAVNDFVSAKLLKQTTKNLPADLSYSEVEQIYDELRSHYAGDLDAAKLLEGAKRGLAAAAGDPYTTYLSQVEAEDLQSSLDGTFSGIGAEIAIKSDRLVVVAPVPDSPAEKAGLAASDYIVSINGESTAEMSVETAVSKIRGPEGTEVTLMVSRGNKPASEVKITRSQISVPAVKSRLEAGNVGYIEFLRFGDDSQGQFAAAVADLKAQGATKFILDLRNNPGGLLSAAIDLSDEFLDTGQIIVEEKKDDKVIKTFRSTSGGSLVGAPVMVLINKGSASASEIVAGALHDNKIAQLVGETTFGKGSVQELIKLAGKNYLKVTIALWYTPGGRNISKEGIEPDHQVELTSDDFNNNRDPQLAKALELLR